MGMECHILRCFVRMLYRGVPNMDILEELKQRLPQSVAVSEMVDVFEEICQIPLDAEEDDVLYETGVFSFDGAEKFYFSLTRQFMTEETDDEYLQLQCALKFPVDAQNRNFNVTYWSEAEEGDFTAFFDTVRQSPAYQFLMQADLHCTDIDLFLEET